MKENLRHYFSVSLSLSSWSPAGPLHCSMIFDNLWSPICRHLTAWHQHRGCGWAMYDADNQEVSSTWLMVFCLHDYWQSAAIWTSLALFGPGHWRDQTWDVTLKQNVTDEGQTWCLKHFNVGDMLPPLDIKYLLLTFTMECIQCLHIHWHKRPCFCT